MHSSGQWPLEFSKGPGIPARNTGVSHFSLRLSFSELQITISGKRGEALSDVESSPWPSSVAASLYFVCIVFALISLGWTNIRSIQIDIKWRGSNVRSLSEVKTEKMWMRDAQGDACSSSGTPRLTLTAFPALE